MQLLALTLAVLAAAPTEVKFASPGFTGVGMQKEYVAYFSEQLAEVLSHEGVRVVTDKEISSLLGFDRQKQLLGCTTETTGSCMAELSSALGVDGLVLGDVAKIGKTFTLTVKVVNAADGARLASFSGRASSEEELLERIGSAGRELAAALRARFGDRIRSSTSNAPQAAAPQGPPPPLRGRSWIPAAGAVVLGAASGLLYAGAVANFNALSANTNSYLGPAVAQQRANDGKLLQGGSFAAAAVGVAALGVAGWMFFAPGPTTPLVVPAASPQGAGVTLIWGAP